MRAESKNRWEPIIGEAVARADANRRQTAPGRGSSPPPVTSSTIEGADGQTMRPMIYDLDSWDDENAFWL